MEEPGKEAMRDSPSEDVADVSQISGCCEQRLQVEELSKKDEFLAGVVDMGASDEAICHPTKIHNSIASEARPGAAKNSVSSPLKGSFCLLGK